MENEGKKEPEFRIAPSRKKASSLCVLCVCLCVLCVCVFSSLCVVLSVSFLCVLSLCPLLSLPNHEKMTSQPPPIFIFVHLVDPFCFSLWSLIFKDDPSSGRPYNRKRNETHSRKEYHPINIRTHKITLDNSQEQLPITRVGLVVRKRGRCTALSFCLFCCTQAPKITLRAFRRTSAVRDLSRADHSEILK